MPADIVRSFAQLLTPIQITILNYVCQREQMPRMEDVAKDTNIGLPAVRAAMVSKTFKEAYKHVFLSSSFASAGAVIEKLGEIALKGKVPAIKLYVQLHGLIKDPKDKNPDDDPLDNKENSPAELIKRRKALEAEYKEIVKKELGIDNNEVKEVSFEVESDPKVEFAE